MAGDGYELPTAMRGVGEICSVGAAAEVASGCGVAAAAEVAAGGGRTRDLDRLLNR